MRFSVGLSSFRLLLDVVGRRGDRGGTELDKVL
jgi:hypothetical protein